MKVIIAGTRTIPERLYLLKQPVLTYEARYGKITSVVSGGARGGDRIGELFAAMREVPLEIYAADWKQYGRAAGHIRNSQMANKSGASGLIALWNEGSPGTRDMIKQASNKSLHILVWNYLTNTEVVLY